MSVAEMYIAPGRAMQRYYPWGVIGIASLTVGMAFGARNAFAVFLVADNAVGSAAARSQMIGLTKNCK